MSWKAAGITLSICCGVVWFIARRQRTPAEEIEEWREEARESLEELKSEALTAPVVVSPAEQAPTATPINTTVEDRAADIRNALEKNFETGCENTDVAVFAERFIKNRLNSPSSADFGWYSDDLVKRNSRYINYSNYVDAQNGFGTTVRTNFTVSLFCDGGYLYITDVSGF